MRRRPTWAEIDLGALKQNFAWLKERGQGAFFCPMVKANAYGHGDTLVSRAVESLGADAVGVALIEEGLQLRAAGVRLPILVFASFESDTVSDLVDQRLTPVLGRREDVLALKGAPAGLPVHLKFNTGMQRLGFDEADGPWLRQALASMRLQVAGTCTHFTHGEDAQDPNSQTARQLETFARLSQGYPGVRHANKSASLIAHATPQIGARPGAALFGIPHGEAPLASALRPVLTWKTHVTHVHRVALGQTVGYGGSWRAGRDTIVGVVPVGYGDGYMRRLGARASMIWRGARVPVVGRVCMDYTMLDLTGAGGSAGQPNLGESVTVLGEGIPAAELARLADTIPYEIVTGISPRVPREAV